MARLWRPIRLYVSVPARAACLVLGLLVYFPALGLYLWGLRTLAANFGPSTGFGVRLQARHRLVTTGPYALVRHPMYVAVIAAGAGGFLIFRTWSMLLFALSMFGLILRARREESVLAEEFGAAWESYRERVPSWLPHGARSGR
jgi:protein-S-isoprenylcysteine O-methyltransferase Ste14